jgi:predicted MFS family arabinose efflux permease
MHSPETKAPALAIWSLGLTQIVGYGTLFYSFSVLAPAMALEFSLPQQWVFAALSAALFLGSLFAPIAGRWADRFGAGRLMTAGSLAASLALVACALAPGRISFVAALIAMELASCFVLYATAFAAIVQIGPVGAQRSITHLTLIAGFASTLFWPLTVWLEGALGWRNVYIAFALLNLLTCVPIHALLRRPREAAAVPTNSPSTSGATPAHTPAPPSAMWFATLGFAFSGFALSAILAQMVPLVTAVGLGTSALLVSTLFGPAQVLIRFINLVAGADRHPIIATLIALALLPAAIAVLAVGSPALIAAVIFALLLGFASGLKSVVQGSLPLALFGAGAYGARLGVMASVRQVLASVAPFVLAFLIEALGVRPALWIIAGVALLGLLCLLQVARQVRGGQGGR